MKRRRMATDRKQRHEVRDELRRRLRAGRAALRRVRCDFVDSTAILWGWVTSEEDRDLAERLIAAQPRVECIENRIVVEQPDSREGDRESVADKPTDELGATEDTPNLFLYEREYARA